MGVRVLQSNYATGEVSNRLRASGDLERYQYALETGQNGIVLPLGAVQRRSGTIWGVDPADTAQDARLLPFAREPGDAVAVLVQASKLRFINVATRSYILSGGTPLEVACPWVAADYAHLFTWQSNDVVWIGDRRGGAAVKVLKRDNNVWQALSDFDVRNGPWGPLNAGARTMTASGVTGAITITASSAYFNANFVGALVRFLENAGAPPVKRWTAAEAVSGGDLRFNGGRVYEAGGGGGTCGNNSPIHDEGTVSDGAVNWIFRHDGAGVAQITAYTNSTQVNATVLTRLPSTSATKYWAIGGYSPRDGYPRAGGIFQERVLLGGAFAAPDRTDMSQSTNYGPDFADFKPGLGTGLVIDSDAVSRALNTDSAEPVLHYVSMGRLYVFTPEGVHMVGGPSLDEPITPAGSSARLRSNYGASRTVAPIKAGDNILYATAGRNELREILPDVMETPNAALLADHIGGRGFAELSWLNAPIPVCAARLDDGGLATMTYEPAQDVRAWMQQKLGGESVEVTSMVSLPDPAGRRELWMVVKRLVNGANYYSIEVLPPAWNRYAAPLEMACCVDAARFFSAWNLDYGNRAQLIVLDDEMTAGEFRTELNSFSASDVGRRVCLRHVAPANGPIPGALAAMARLDITEFVDAKTVRGKIVGHGTGNVALLAWPTGAWAIMSSVLFVGPGLAGQSVDVFGDGAAQMDLRVSETGYLTLNEPIARGWIGLRAPFVLVDMPAAFNGGDGAVLGAPKKVQKAWVIAEDAPPGLTLFNPDNPTETTPLVLRSPDDAQDVPPAPISGYVAAAPKGGWSENGQLGIRLDAPFPCTILGAVKEIDG